MKKEFKVITELQDAINTALQNAASEGWEAVSHTVHVYTVNYDVKPRVLVSVMLQRKLAELVERPKASRPEDQNA